MNQNHLNTRTPNNPQHSIGSSFVKLPNGLIFTDANLNSNEYNCNAAKNSLPRMGGTNIAISKPLLSVWRTEQILSGGDHEHKSTSNNSNQQQYFAYNSNVAHNKAIIGNLIENPIAAPIMNIHINRGLQPLVVNLNCNVFNVNLNMNDNNYTMYTNRNAINSSSSSNSQLQRFQPPMGKNANKAALFPEQEAIVHHLWNCGVFTKSKEKIPKYWNANMNFENKLMRPRITIIEPKSVDHSLSLSKVSNELSFISRYKHTSCMSMQKLVILI